MKCLTHLVLHNLLKALLIINHENAQGSVDPSDMSYGELDIWEHGGFKLGGVKGWLGGTVGDKLPRSEVPAVLPGLFFIPPFFVSLVLWLGGANDLTEVKAS
ncbi:hypothetical protein FRC02_011301 [Tulasnella sp. 418]|nr:hypothetical protein FRC02_011301 [Tulasnella sp. 418]